MPTVVSAKHSMPWLECPHQTTGLIMTGLKTITQVSLLKIAKSLRVSPAENNLLWKDGMLECWNIGNKIGIKLFEL
jgi:hypothetical protein